MKRTRRPSPMSTGSVIERPLPKHARSSEAAARRATGVCICARVIKHQTSPLVTARRLNNPARSDAVAPAVHPESPTSMGARSVTGCPSAGQSLQRIVAREIEASQVIPTMHGTSTREQPRYLTAAAPRRSRAC